MHGFGATLYFQEFTEALNQHNNNWGSLSLFLSYHYIKLKLGVSLKGQRIAVLYLVHQ